MCHPRMAVNNIYIFSCAVPGALFLLEYAPDCLGFSTAFWTSARSWTSFKIVAAISTYTLHDDVLGPAYLSAFRTQNAIHVAVKSTATLCTDTLVFRLCCWHLIICPLLSIFTDILSQIILFESHIYQKIGFLYLLSIIFSFAYQVLKLYR